MAYNGSGTFVRLFTWTTDKTNLVPVTASRMDSEMDGMATGLSTAICKDGQTATTARIPFASGTSAFAGALSGVSYAQTNDANTGLYFPAADQYGLVAGGTATITSTATKVTVPVALDVTGALVVSGGVTGVFASGTAMLFVQTAAPTGWTKSTTHDDKALRVVSGAASSGGTNAFSTVMAQTTVGGTAISIAQMPAHTHGGATGSDGSHTHTYNDVQDGFGSIQGAGGTFGSTGGTTGSNGAHTHTIASQGGGSTHNHTITLSMSYVDVIIATKD